jgi:hypothetical protein
VVTIAVLVVFVTINPPKKNVSPSDVRVTELVPKREFHDSKTTLEVALLVA